MKKTATNKALETATKKASTARKTANKKTADAVKAERKADALATARDELEKTIHDDELKKASEKAGGIIADAVNKASEKDSKTTADDKKRLEKASKNTKPCIDWSSKELEALRNRLVVFGNSVYNADSVRAGYALELKQLADSKKTLAEKLASLQYEKDERDAFADELETVAEKLKTKRETMSVELKACAFKLTRQEKDAITNYNNNDGVPANQRVKKFIFRAFRDMYGVDFNNYADGAQLIAYASGATIEKTSTAHRVKNGFELKKESNGRKVLDMVYRCLYDTAVKKHAIKEHTYSDGVKMAYTGKTKKPASDSADK